MFVVPRECLTELETNSRRFDVDQCIVQQRKEFTVVVVSCVEHEAIGVTRELRVPAGLDTNSLKELATSISIARNRNSVEMRCVCLLPAAVRSSRGEAILRLIALIKQSGTGYIG
jgi:hypothetical protein